MKFSKTRLLKIVIGILIAALLIIFLIKFFDRSTKYSTPGLLGNTAGNLYNKGIFCESGDRIYFSNIFDDGHLYSMKKNFTDFKIHYEDKVRYINADENYIYYSRMNNLKAAESETVFVFYSNGIFRIDKSTGNLYMLHNLPIGSLVLFNNTLYYQYYKKGENLSINTIDISGKEGVKLIEDDCVAVNVYNNNLYYADRLHDNMLYSVSLQTGNRLLEEKIDAYLPIVNEDGIYYISSTEGYKLCFITSDRSERKIIANCSCSTYNVSEGGRFIFYQRDDASDKNGVYVYDTVRDETDLILAGDYKWFNIAGDHLFFCDFTESQMYAYNKLSGELSVFNPPVITR